MKKDDARKLTKTSKGSLYVILPRKILAALGWKEHQKLNVKKAKGSVVIRDWKRRK